MIIGTRDSTAPGRHWKKPNTVYEFGRYDKLGSILNEYNRNIDVVELNSIGHLPQIENFDKFRAVMEIVIDKN